jgi:hypothetical protein
MKPLMAYMLQKYSSFIIPHKTAIEEHSHIFGLALAKMKT